MKSKAILVSLLAVLAIVSLVATVIASDLNVSVSVKVNDIELDGSNVAIQVGDTIPVVVQMTAGQDIDDAKVKVYISGEDAEAETGKFNMLDGRTYSKSLSLKTPASIDETPSEDLTLVVVVESRDGEKRETFEFTLQRPNYNLEILNAEVENSATAGNVLALDIVIKNRGSERADDNFVIVRIPTLGVEKKAYFGDLTPVDCEDDECEKEDASERRMFISIPSDTQAGVYTLEIQAYNDETSTTLTKSISIGGTEENSQVLTAVTSKDVAKGQTATYDLIIVNPGNKIVVYNVVPETVTGLGVSVDQPLITVPAGSSKTVRVSVTGNTVGTYAFAVNVESNGKLVQKVNLSANVTSAGIASNNIVILTIVLAIVFVVLLVVLIVLLSRKPEKVEEFGESYY